ncbi:hypothetical protein ACFS7Z_08460 [Pontibacter toksunensis]|uniref:Uncharacterized protein n=1 Tax=Pontibacter toksunensis TaxID=1332631 RepID=A0ABW6BTU7_9BACT
MEQDEINQTSERKVYTTNSIWYATFLGGPLTAGYLIAENFKTLGQRNKVLATWVITILATIIIFKLSEYVTSHRYALPLFCAGVAWLIAMNVQGKKIKSYVSAEGRTFSVIHCIGVGVVWCALTVLPLIGYAYFADPFYNTATAYYGQLRHEVYYTKNIYYGEVDKVVDALTQSGYFGEDYQRFIFLEKKDDKYIVSIFIEEDCLNDQETVDYLEEVRLYAQYHLIDNRLVFNLCEEEVTEVRKVLE